MAHSVWWDPLFVFIVKSSKGTNSKKNLLLVRQTTQMELQTSDRVSVPNQLTASEQTRSMATSHFQPLKNQLCCQSCRLDDKSTGSTFSFRKPVGFQPCLLESNPEHRPTLFSLYPLCNTIKFQVKVWAGLSSNEWVLQTTALRKNTGWKTGKQFKYCLFPFSTWLFCSLFQDAVCMYKWVLF